MLFVVEQFLKLCSVLAEDENTPMFWVFYFLVPISNSVFIWKNP